MKERFSDFKEEIRALVELIEKENGQPFDVQPALVESTGHNINSLVFGGKIDTDSDKKKETFELMTAITKENEKLINIALIPFALKVIAETWS